MMTAGVVLIFVGLVLAFEAGRAHQAVAARWQKQSAAQFDAAMAPSRGRHPSGRVS